MHHLMYKILSNYLFRVFFLDLEGVLIKRVSLRVNQVGYLQASKEFGMIQINAYIEGKRS